MAYPRLLLTVPKTEKFIKIGIVGVFWIGSVVPKT
jgi:hypothetical protein